MVFVVGESHRTLCRAFTTAAWKRGRRGSYVRTEVHSRGEATMDPQQESHNRSVANHEWIVSGTYQDRLRELRVSADRPEMLPNGCPAYASATHTVPTRAGVTRQPSPVGFFLLQFPELKVDGPPPLRIRVFHSDRKWPETRAQCLDSTETSSQNEITQIQSEINRREIVRTDLHYTTAACRCHASGFRIVKDCRNVAGILAYPEK